MKTDKTDPPMNHPEILIIRPSLDKPKRSSPKKENSPPKASSPPSEMDARLLAMKRAEAKSRGFDSPNPGMADVAAKRKTDEMKRRNIDTNRQRV